MRRILASATVVLTVALSGCSGGSSAPTTLPPVPVPASSSPSATATPVPTPSGMNAATPQGASAFTKYWFEVLTSAYATADTSVLRALSAPGCATCMNFIGSVEKLSAAGHRLEGPAFKVIDAQSPALNGGTAVVTVDYEAPARTEVGPGQAVIATYPARSNGVLTATVQRTPNGWIMKYVAV